MSKIDEIKAEFDEELRALLAALGCDDYEPNCYHVQRDFAHAMWHVYDFVRRIKALENERDS